MASEPLTLYSERHGRVRTLTDDDVATLVWKRIALMRDRKWLFKGSFSGYRGLAQEPEPPRIRDAEEFLIMRLKVSGIGFWLLKADEPPSFLERDVLIDLIELLHAEIVALPLMVHPPEDTTIEAFDQEAGQKLFRDELNPALALAEPPLELLPSGHVVERSAEHGDLYAEPLPADAEPELRDPVEAVVAQFLRPGATVQDKRAAVKHLADVLERIRDEVKVELLRKDEAALFEIANNFALRHYNRQQKTDYDKPVWLDWAFHVFLTTIRAVVRVRDRDASDGAS